MKSLAEVIDATLSTGRGLSGSLALRKLVNMLRNMQRSYPRARLLQTSRGVCGVLLDESTSISVFVNGSWSDQDLRDCFALFATWCVVDREGLIPSTPQRGRLATESAPPDLGPGPLASRGKR